MSAPAPSPLAIAEVDPAHTPERQGEVLTDAALAFVAELHRRFTPRRDELLARRAERRAEIARTSTLDFLPGPRRSARTTAGRSPRRRPRSTTAGWRSPAPPTAR